MTDFVELNGQAIGYVTLEMENGDKIFSKGGYTSQSYGDGNLQLMQATHITGGTGKFLGIRGLLRSTSGGNPKAGTNTEKLDLEYWMMK